MRRYITEFVGTFFLVLTIVCTVRAGSTTAPLAIGAVLAAMVFAGGHVSGAHYNPAVTLAVWLRGRVATRDVPGYVVSQVAGAAVAAAAGRLLVAVPASAPLSLHGRGLAAAFFAELLFTAALAYVVLNVATSSDHPDNSFYGLAIGFTVLAGAVAVGPVSGGVFNPAVTVGAGVAGLVSPSLLWPYVAVQLLGAALAAVAFRVVNTHERLRGPARAQLPAPRPAADDLSPAVPVDTVSESR